MKNIHQKYPKDGALLRVVSAIAGLNTVEIADRLELAPGYLRLIINGDRGLSRKSVRRLIELIRQVRRDLRKEAPDWLKSCDNTLELIMDTLWDRQ